MEFSSNQERPVSAVPAWILWLLAAALATHMTIRFAQPARTPSAADLPNAPTAQALRLANLGEPAALARLAMIWLQAFDSSGDNAVPYRRLDYARLVTWLRAILATDPRSGYPLFAASRIYAENADPARARIGLKVRRHCRPSAAWKTQRQFDRRKPGLAVVQRDWAWSQSLTSTDRPHRLVHRRRPGRWRCRCAPIASR